MTDDEILENGIVAACELIVVHLIFGEYTLATEKFNVLTGIMQVVTHDEMVAMVNKHNVTSRISGWIAKSWCKAHGIENSIIEFETAGLIASPGESFQYRRNKKTWGNLESIRLNIDSGPLRPGTSGEDQLRMQFWLKTNNPIMLKQMTRNELKIVMGSPMVCEAMRNKKGNFIKGVSTAEIARIERVTGLSIDKVWSSIRNGNKSLVEHLGLRPSNKREQMRLRGMYVADYYEPQLDLFAA